MWRTDRIAEQRIEAAIAKGEFDNLPGQGQPLNLEEDRLVAPEIRMAYRVLKNAGYVPEEIILRKEIAQVEKLLATLEEGEIRTRAIARLSLLSAKLGARRGAKENFSVEASYQQKVIERMSEPTGT